MRNRLRIIAFAALTGVMVPGSLFAQTPIRGQVTDPNGSALGNASVVLRQATTGLARYGVQTGEEGRFEILRVQPGRYELFVSFLGFRSSTSDLEITTSNVVSMTAKDGGNNGRPTDAIMAEITASGEILIVLEPQLVPYPEVVVSFQRTDAQIQPVTVSNISAEEVEQATDMKDLPTLLARQPSITTYSENGNAMGYSTLRMRGFDQRRLAIAINGIPQNDPEEFNVFWINFFDIQGVIEDIQIQRGAGSSLYGSAAIGGAVNIRAMPYRPNPYARVEVGGGAYNTRRYTAELNSGLIGEKVVFFGRLSRLLSDGYRDWSWTEFWRFFAGATLYGNNSTLTIQAYGGPQKDGLAYSGIPKSANKETITDDYGTKIDRRYNFSSFDGDNEHFHQPHLELHHELSFSPSLTLNQSLFWIQGTGYFDFGGTFRSANYLRLPDGFVPDEERDLPLYISKPDATVLFRASLDQWQVGWMPRMTFVSGRLRLTAGLELRLHRSLRWGRMEQGSGVPEELVGSENDVRVYSFRSEKTMTSVYASSVYQVSPILAVQGDLQLTYRKYRFYEEAFFENEFDKSYAFANPRLGVTLFPGAPFSLYTSVAYAQREPRMKSLYDGEEAGAGTEPGFGRNPDGSWNTGMPFVSSENLVDIELGARWSRERGRFSVNLFYMDFADEIVPSGGLDQFGVPRTGNADRSVHAGVEIDAALSVAPGLQFKANATVSRNRFKKFVEYVTLPDYSSSAVVRDDNTIAGFPDETANLGLLYAAGGLSTQIMFAYVGRAYADNSEGILIDGTYSDDLLIDSYSLVDATLAYEFSTSSALTGLRISAALNNVLNQKVLPYGNVGVAGPQYFPAATRHAYIGVRYTLQ